MKAKKLKKKIKKYVASEVLTLVRDSEYLARMTTMYGPRSAYDIATTMIIDHTLAVYVIPSELGDYVYGTVEGYALLIKAAINRGKIGEEDREGSSLS